MYLQLRLFMIKRNIKIKDLSVLLQLNRNTITKKLNGISPFYVEEFIKIKNIFFTKNSLDILCIKE